ncbi:hypothetical protein MAH4_03970 [Sessilibacter sp. MAH4]
MRTRAVRANTKYLRQDAKGGAAQRAEAIWRLLVQFLEENNIPRNLLGSDFRVVKAIFINEG